MDSNGFSLGSHVGCPLLIAALFGHRVHSSVLQMSCLIVSFELFVWNLVVDDDGHFTIAVEVAVKCFDYRSPGLAAWMKF